MSMVVLNTGWDGPHFKVLIRGSIIILSLHILFVAITVVSCLFRQMAEKEETFKKKDEEKRKKEEQEEQEKDQKLRLANERLRQERPQRLEELRKMDLDHAPIRELKSIMEKMGISSVGCLSRKDLKEKLLENVPELRLTATSGTSPTASSKTSVMGASSELRAFFLEGAANFVFGEAERGKGILCGENTPH